MSSPTQRIDGVGTPRARCLLAPNPSPMTLEGTNTWVIAEPGSGRAVVVDPGPDSEPHLDRVRDHAAGAAAFAAMTGAPVRAADPAHRLGGEGLAPGDTLTAGGCEVRVVATPGHSADSVCLHLPADRALLTGDTVLGRGTTVIARDGSLADYLASLDRLRSFMDEAEITVLLPGHGPLLTDPAGTLDFYIAHRRERLAEITAALDAGDRTPAQIVARVYTDVDASLQRFAEQSVRAQLDYLGAQGRLPPDVMYK